MLPGDKRLDQHAAAWNRTGELPAQTEQLQLVAELGRRALTEIRTQELMSEALDLLAANLELDCGDVLELLPNGRAVPQAVVGWPAEVESQLSAELHDRTPAGQVLLTQAPVLVADLPNDNRFPGPSLLHARGMRGSLTVPLCGRTRPLGVLGVHTTSVHDWSATEVYFTQAVANILAAALECNWQEERARERHFRRAEQMMALGQVAAGVAHELRNPLTAIKGLVQVNLREARTKQLPSEDLNIIEHEIRRMERTLQIFLDFARPPQPDRRPLNLISVLERVFALVGGRAKKQKVVLQLLSPEAPVWVVGDQDQLQQLLLNLVLNALDAMPSGGSVEIDVRSPAHNCCELHIRDSGPGIAPHILPKVFETFISSKETGLGLGLPLSRRIAEDHGGTLSAYNLPGRGACFLLRLPLAASPLSHENGELSLP